MWYPNYYKKISWYSNTRNYIIGQATITPSLHLTYTLIPGKNEKKWEIAASWTFLIYSTNVNPPNYEHKRKEKVMQLSYIVDYTTNIFSF
jgi:hypothetical protein